jgi:hypothetical protein
MVSYVLADIAYFIIAALWATSKVSDSASSWAIFAQSMITFPGFIAEISRSQVAKSDDDFLLQNRFMKEFLKTYFVLTSAISICFLVV